MAEAEFGESPLPLPPRQWRFGQCFGEKDTEGDFSEADLLTTVRFDESGDYLATGDKGGRVIIFERGDTPKGRLRRRRPDIHDDTDANLGAEYKFYTEFQSHDAEFDYLKSQEIEEKINQVAWCRRSSSALMLLSTNDKTIKLWKVHERATKTVANMNVETGQYGGAISPVTSLHMPTLIPTSEPQVVAATRRVYGNAHAYHINSIAVNSDGQTFLSADDLRINLWSLENARLSFNVVDMKPPTLEELTEVITAAEFHPSSCNLFMYASSRGSIRLADMRAAALCDSHAKIFEDAEDASAKSYFSEIIASVSGISFTRDGRYIISRDYLSVKVWDVNMESRPVRVIPVHEHLRPKLVELYESDSIFDKFEVCCSASGSCIMTGSYNNAFKLYDVEQGIESSLELSKSRPRPAVTRPIPDASALGSNGDVAMGGVTGDGEDEMDFSKKVLHYSWHPTEDVVAVCGHNNLFLYTATRATSSIA